MKKIKKTQSAKLDRADLPKRGESTFSVVDGMAEKNLNFYPIPNYTKSFDRMIELLEKDRNINIEPEINIGPARINVEPTPINIDVNPTPIEVTVPTQRIPEVKPPTVIVKNDFDMLPIVLIGGLIFIVLLADVIIKIWQLPM